MNVIFILFLLQLRQPSVKKKNRGKTRYIYNREGDEVSECGGTSKSG